MKTPPSTPPTSQEPLRPALPCMPEPDCRRVHSILWVTTALILTACQAERSEVPPRGSLTSTAPVSTHLPLTANTSPPPPPELEMQMPEKARQKIERLRSAADRLEKTIKSLHRFPGDKVMTRDDLSRTGFFGAYKDVKSAHGSAETVDANHADSYAFDGTRGILTAELPGGTTATLDLRALIQQVREYIDLCRMEFLSTRAILTALQREPKRPFTDNDFESMTDVFLSTRKRLGLHHSHPDLTTTIWWNPDKALIFVRLKPDNGKSSVASFTTDQFLDPSLQLAIEGSHEDE